MDGSEAQDGGVDEDEGERGDNEEHEYRDEVAELAAEIHDVGNIAEDGSGAGHYQVPSVISDLF